MTVPHRTSSTESADSIRKRVGKACDRCRLKKSKCDGSSPCSRCRADNTICVFGERKKSHDKVYPKGYVEMLEQQQSQLVAGLQETYRRLVTAQAWPGAPLAEHSGNPLTHDILARLDLLEPKQDGSGEMETFEEDCKELQKRLTSDGAPLVGRRGSFSSDSDHDHVHRHARNSSHSSMHATPGPIHTQPVLEENWTGFQSSPSPIQSPPPSLAISRPAIKPSPLSHEPVISQDDFLIPSWQDNDAFTQGLMRSNFALQAPVVQDNLSAMMGTYSQSMDSLLDIDNSPMAYNNQSFNVQTPGFGMYTPQDWMNEPMDVDFSKFVQVST